MQPLCFCDCETTGFYVDAGHEAWEIAVLVVRDEHVEERTWQLPVDVSKADPMSIAMNGWYSRSLQQKFGDRAWETFEHGETVRWTHDRWAREFMDLVHGCTLIGAVPSFDERFLTRALRQGGGVPCWHYQPVDVETLAVGWVLGMAEATVTVSAAAGDVTTSGEQELAEAAAMLRTPPWDSEAISRVVGVNPDLFERHSALGDCRWAKAIWDMIMTAPSAFEQRDGMLADSKGA